MVITGTECVKLTVSLQRHGISDIWLKITRKQNIILLLDTKCPVALFVHVCIELYMVIF